MPTWGISAPGTAALDPFPSISDAGWGHSPHHGKAPEFVPELRYAVLSHPCAAAASRFPGCGRRLHWEALPRATPHGEKWEGGSGGALCLRSPPGSKCQATSSRRDQPSRRAACFAAIPVAAALAGAAVASETVCVPPGSCARHGQPGPVGQVAAGLGQPGQLSLPILSLGWPGAPSSPCMNVYFLRTDADHGI